MLLRNLTPDVSIIMPVKEKTYSMDKAIESVFQQSVPRPLSVELVIIKDGVDTYYLNSKIAGYVRQSAKYEWLYIRIAELIRNEGQSVARNYGIKISSGKYICYLDTDDTMHPSRIETAVDSFENINTNAYGILNQYDIIQWDESLSRKLREHNILNTANIGKEKEIVKNKRFSFLLPFMHKRSLYNELVDIYGHFFVPGLVDQEDKVLFRRIIENNFLISYCNRPSGTINLSPLGQLSRKRMPNTKRGFRLDNEHLDGPNGQYLDTIKDLSILATETFPTMKVCTVCKRTLPLTAFGPWEHSPDLKKIYCKSCGATAERKNYRRKKNNG